MYFQLLLNFLISIRMTFVFLLDSFLRWFLMRLFSDIVTYLWFYIQIEGGLRSKRRTHTANLWSRWRPVADPERTAVFSIIFTKIEYDFRVCRRVCGTSNSFLKTGQVLFGELTSRHRSTSLNMYSKASTELSRDPETKSWTTRSAPSSCRAFFVQSCT